MCATLCVQKFVSMKGHVSRSRGVGPQVSTAILLPGLMIGASGMSPMETVACKQLVGKGCEEASKLK
jgi:hypothetical protein